MKISPFEIDIDLLPVNIAIYKVNSKGEFIFRDLNKKAQETDKISRDKVLGKNVVEVFPGIIKMGLLDTFASVYKFGEAQESKTIHYEDDKISGWRKNTVTKIADDLIMAVYEDMTLIKEFELEIEKKSRVLKQLSSAFKNKALDLQRAQALAKIGSWRYKIEKDILVVSDEIYKIFKIDKRTNPIKNRLDFLSKIDTDYGKHILTMYDEHLKSRKMLECIHQIKFENGTSKWIEERWSTEYNKDGKPIISNGTMHDITAFKEQELSLKKKDILLLQHSRLAQMGEMISMIAHQWRQPLSAISVTSIDLQMKLEFKTFNLDKKEEQDKFLDYIDNGLNNINRLVHNLTMTIDDFRNFYKPNKVSIQLKLKDIVEKAMSVIESSLLGNNIEVNYIYNADKTFDIYANELMQVILNLLKNSQDNFKEKKVKKPKITIRIEENSLSICDNGGGIEEKIIKQIFDPYFTTKNEKNGSGLGLYMSKTIVEEHHNATLGVINTDSGVCFSIIFKEKN